MPAENPRQAYPKKKLTVVTFASRREKPPSRQAPDLQPQALAPTPKPSPPAPPPISPPAAAAEPKPLSPAGRRKLARKAALAWLKETYPHLFCRPPLPLALGIGAAIVARACQSGFKPYANRDGIALLDKLAPTTSRRSAPTKGTMRRALNGAPVEPVADEHQVDARERIAALEAAQRRRGAEACSHERDPDRSAGL